MQYLDTINEFQLNNVIIDDYSINELKAMIKNIEYLYCCKELKVDINKFICALLADRRKNVNNLGAKLSFFKSKSDAEEARVSGMYKFDLSFGSFRYIAGVDEVGRGPLAGPIASAAVVLDPTALSRNDIILGIKDSKKLSPSLREELSEIIKEKSVSYSIALIENDDIDTKGIAWCNNEVFKIACKNLNIIPDLVLSDGYAIKGTKLKNQYVIKGDEKSAAIACASIIAKVYRDNLMMEYSKIYPYYGFDKNMGYGTKEHIDGILKYGTCSIHRGSFLTNLTEMYK